MRARWGWRSCLVMLWLFSGAATAAGPSSRTSEPVVSIIIDDLGRQTGPGLRTIRLPGPVACSFLPHSRHTRELALTAHAHNKEVLLHLPMQSMAERPLDPGGLSMDMTQREFIQALQEDLALVPHVQGVNNHMGSLLTRHPGHMLWLMQELNRRGQLFFVDSRTTSETVAVQIAHENQVPNLERDVFLDHDRRPEAIRGQFHRLMEVARRSGSALGIGHPDSATLSVLEEMIPELERQGIRLIPLTEMIQLRQARRQTWQASLSPSPKVARNSKPLP